MDTCNGQNESGTPVTVGPFVREQIRARLQQALCIADNGLGGQLARFRRLLAEVSDRVEGLELTATATANAQAAQPSSSLPFAAFATARGEPVTEFLLIPFGEVVVERPIAGDSFVFTRSHAEAAKQWFDRMGRKLAVDYEHQSFDTCNPRCDGLRPAAGWIGGLEVRADGLWAVDVTWTARASELLRSGEYRYFSPVIFWTDEDQTALAALGPVALTNDPAMRGVCPLAAKRRRDEEDEPDVELEAARREIDVLRRQLLEQEAQAFVERGLRLGKIVECTSADWRTDYLRDPEETAERLSHAPVLRPPGRVIVPGQRAVLPPRTSGPSGPWAVDAEDWAAYERAAAAGRVLTAGR